MSSTKKKKSPLPSSIFKIVRTAIRRPSWWACCSAERPKGGREAAASVAACWEKGPEKRREKRECNSCREQRDSDKKQEGRQMARQEAETVETGQKKNNFRKLKKSKQPEEDT